MARAIECGGQNEVGDEVTWISVMSCVADDVGVATKCDDLSGGE